jgi:hypothetical protein
MDFKQALEKLGIEDYADRIFKSNSHGELFHLQQYIVLATFLDNEEKWFRGWFENIVKFAEKEWNRPESVFQHIDKAFADTIKQMNESK